MKKKIVVFLLAGAMGLSLAGCSTSSENTQKQGAANEAAEDQTAGIDDMGTDETENQDEELYETEPSLEPINPSDYLVENAADYVTLGDFSGIPVEKTVYEITDEMVQDRINEELEAYGEEVEADHPAQEDDTIYGTLTYTFQGEEEEEPYKEEEFFLTIGFEEYGEEFDEKVTGCSKGDKLEFSISYPEDSEIVEWAGKTVDFVYEVTDVYSMIIPEYNEEFVKDTVGFETMEEYEANIRETLESEYEEVSYEEAAETLFEEAVERSEFKDEYPQELYDACREENLETYAMFSGAESEEEIYETTGITEEDIEEQTLSMVRRRLLVSAYCLANDITLTEDDYVSYLEGNAALYGEPDIVSFEDFYGRNYLVWAMYEARFTEALYEQADITEVPYDPSADEEMTEVYSEE